MDRFKDLTDDCNDDEDNTINHLDIAEGLKNVLVRYGFKLDS
jgi:hypothetical protein